MARILVNYIYNKAKDEFKVLDQDCVYADQRIAVIETEDIINKPLVVPIKGAMTVVDRERYERVNKRFYLAANEQGEVREEPNGAEIWLPKDTDISKLRFINGQLVYQQDEPKENKEQPKTKKTQPKKNTN